MREFKFLKFSTLLIILCIFINITLLELNADTLYLKNSRKIDGFIEKEDNDFIVFDVCQGTVTFKREEIESMRRSEAEESARLRRECEEQKKKLKNAPAPAAKPKQKSKPQDVAFVQSDKGLLVNVVLNRSVQASLILDTGSSLVVLTKAVADRLGMNLHKIKQEGKLILADGREVIVKPIILKSINTHGVEAENVEAAVLLEDPGELKFGDGLLGMSFLKNFNFKVDHKNNKLILEKF